MVSNVTVNFSRASTSRVQRACLAASEPARRAPSGWSECGRACQTGGADALKVQQDPDPRGWGLAAAGIHNDDAEAVKHVVTAEAGDSSVRKEVEEDSLWGRGEVFFKSRRKPEVAGPVLIFRGLRIRMGMHCVASDSCIK